MTTGRVSLLVIKPRILVCQTRSLVAMLPALQNGAAVNTIENSATTIPV